MGITKELEKTDLSDIFFEDDKCHCPNWNGKSLCGIPNSEGYSHHNMYIYRGKVPTICPTCGKKLCEKCISEWYRKWGWRD